MVSRYWQLRLCHCCHFCICCFSGIQIFGLFLGKMQLPEGYTYAQYAREGFFQLLAVSILNLILVLVCLSFFLGKVRY
ncbi:MAG: DUF4153 domain-containing protein [Waltera sp.]